MAEVSFSTSNTNGPQAVTAELPDGYGEIQDGPDKYRRGWGFPWWRVGAFALFSRQVGGLESDEGAGIYAAVGAAKGVKDAAAVEVELAQAEVTRVNAEEREARELKDTLKSELNEAIGNEAVLKERVRVAEAEVRRLEGEKRGADEALRTAETALRAARTAADRAPLQADRDAKAATVAEVNTALTTAGETKARETGLLAEATSSVGRAWDGLRDPSVAQQLAGADKIIKESPKNKKEANDRLSGAHSKLGEAEGKLAEAREKRAEAMREAGTRVGFFVGYDRIFGAETTWGIQSDFGNSEYKETDGGNEVFAGAMWDPFLAGFSYIKGTSSIRATNSGRPDGSGLRLQGTPLFTADENGPLEPPRHWGVTEDEDVDLNGWNFWGGYKFSPVTMLRIGCMILNPGEIHNALPWDKETTFKAKMAESRVWWSGLSIWFD